MYIGYNDNELIYLIKYDNNDRARKLLYGKYSHYIRKLYHEMNFERKILYIDFQQECLIILEKAIAFFDERQSVSFFSFFSVCVKRRIYKLSKEKKVYLQEEKADYNQCDKLQDYSFCEIKKVLMIEFKNADPIEWLLIEKCMLEGYKIKSICSDYGLNYEKTYYIYKKLRRKVEKILTK